MRPGGFRGVTSTACWIAGTANPSVQIALEYFMRAIIFLPVLTIGFQEARAQGTPTTFTNSTSHTQTLHTTSNTSRFDAFSTRLTARIGSDPVVYDHTFTGELSDPPVQAAIQQAKNQLSASVAPNLLVFSGPNLLNTSTTRAGSIQKTLFNGAQTTTDIATITTLGPATIRTGDLGLCSALLEPHQRVRQ